MSFHENSTTACFKSYNQLVKTVPTEKETLRKIRTVPNILKRSKEMDHSRTKMSTSVIKNNIEMRKQIFDPVRSELLTWENRHVISPVISEVTIDDIDKYEKQSSAVALGVLEHSPMWCPTSAEKYFNEQAIKIIETVTVNLPIGDITSSICSEYIEQDFYDFHREMNISISDLKNIDVETVIELGRFECYVSKDNLRASMQEDPFDKIIIRNSWSKFECLTCGKIYRSQFGLNNHLQVKHHRITKKSANPVIVLTCPRCFKIFKTYSGYDRHMNRCHTITQCREE